MRGQTGIFLGLQKEMNRNEHGLKGCGASFWNDESVLKLDRSGSYTML